MQVLTGSTNAYGGDLRIPKEGLDPFNTSLAEAAQVLEDAGQAIVIRPGYGSNPFDAEAYAGENSVSVNGLREGGVSTFTLFLPFAASEKGQRVELKLSGPNADKFQVLLYADPVPVAGDGTFELTVPEGARQLVFSLRAGQDVDSDQVLSLDAQLADDEGDATHRNHAELTINFDAVAEAATDHQHHGIGYGAGRQPQQHRRSPPGGWYDAQQSRARTCRTRRGKRQRG